MLGVTRRAQLTRHVESLVGDIKRPSTLPRPEYKELIPDDDQVVLKKYHVLDQIPQHHLQTMFPGHQPSYVMSEQDWLSEVRNIKGRIQTVDTEDEVQTIISDLEQLISQYPVIAEV